MKPRKIKAKDFHQNYGPRVKRIWDHNTQRGIGWNEFEHQSDIDINDLTHIFVRDDGWTIAATDQGAHQCEQLWPQEWREIVQKQAVGV